MLLTDRIRRGFALVEGLAEKVAVRHDRLDAYAASLPPHPPVNLFDTDHHHIGTAEETAAYALTLDAVNFGSGYKPGMEAEGWRLIEGSIYFTVATRLKHRFEGQGAFDAAALEGMDDAGIRSLFALPRGPDSDAFAGLCARGLRDLGRAAAGAGSFEGLVRSANGSAGAMAEILSRIESFHDEQAYKGHAIPFYKRAQIAAADLHLAYGHMGVVLFNDMHRLTMFADNGVPHVLRVDGILEYAPDLARRIDAGEEVTSGSPEEVEIRACAGHAVELLAARKGLTAVNIDHILWHKSVEEGGRYAALPPHCTRTMAY